MPQQPMPAVGCRHKFNISNCGCRSIAHDGPTQCLADFSQRVGAFISEDDEVVRHERHHEIIAVTTDRYCSLLSLENVFVCFCCWHWRSPCTVAQPTAGLDNPTNAVTYREGNLHATIWTATWLKFSVGRCFDDTPRRTSRVRGIDPRLGFCSSQQLKNKKEAATRAAF